MESPDTALTAADWVGHPLSTDALATLHSYADWLGAEAMPAGGLGPKEGSRIWTRHIGDSLVFASGWPAASPPALLDIGTGVGLPGIPLAILWPDCEVTLLDRAGRRVRLLQRAARVLGLDNVTVVQGDAFDQSDEWPGLVFRGSVPPPQAVDMSAQLLAPSGTAVVGLSRRPERPDAAADLLARASSAGLWADVAEVPATILETPAWLLIMRAGEHID